ncbi:hypothetical protein PH562_14660 [Rhizobium sp. CNPSo 4062]|uniref:hypothetical protein n=1 Tax=Rhizobium sp. CNPSo 4062 TaxID=3021410 RepID=UPI00254D15D8|nr:hypothetical protein [Rhizobium sp. CNPSo 4062]MDK4703492.1 hypothetical protein [Rhizobium sp. CNPSo 4062]
MSLTIGIQPAATDNCAEISRLRPGGSELCASAMKDRGLPKKVGKKKSTPALPKQHIAGIWFKIQMFGRLIFPLASPRMQQNGREIDCDATTDAPQSKKKWRWLSPAACRR